MGDIEDYAWVLQILCDTCNIQLVGRIVVARRARQSAGPPSLRVPAAASVKQRISWETYGSFYKQGGPVLGCFYDILGPY